MAEVTIDGMRQYGYVIDEVLSTGHQRAPRGQKTTELLGVTIINTNPYDCLAPPWRKPNLAIAAAEALQLLAGVSYPELMMRVAVPFGNFLDGGIFHGAYGPRTRTQLAHVVSRLERDPDTRQAVMVIWDPLHDLMITGEDVPRDVPCTLSFQYFLVNGQLEAHTHMRSNDVWLGLAYDVTQFTILADAIAKALNTELRRYVHHVGSLHVYDRDVEKIEAMRQMQELQEQLATDGGPAYVPERLHAPCYDGTLADAIERARLLLRGDLQPSTASERWFRDMLEKYVG